MMRSFVKWNLVVLAVAVGLTCAAGAAFADSITVANASFEILPSGGFNNNPGTQEWTTGEGIPGWTTTGNGTGIWNPEGYKSNPPAYAGSYLGYTYEGTISQDVGTAVAGSDLTLSVEVLHRTDWLMDGFVQLEIGGVVVATATVVDAPDNGPGTWNDWTLSYIPTSGQAGETITILLGGPGQQADFDDVRMTRTSVPEPSVLSLLTLGLFG
jgi:hypothetical protein